MNETEWLACEDPVLMMSFLGTSFRGRKRLLVGMAICCRIRHLLGVPLPRSPSLRCNCRCFGFSRPVTHLFREWLSV